MIIICFTKQGYEEYPLTDSICIDDIHITLQNNNVYLEKEETRIQMDIQKKYHIDQYDFICLLEEYQYFYKESPLILIGQDQADISIKQGRYVIEGQTVSITQGFFYLNGIKQSKKSVCFQYGDQIMINHFIILTVFDRFIRVQSLKSLYHCSLLAFKPKEIQIFYECSPRLFKQLPHSTIEIQKPPLLVKKKKRYLKLILPPLISVGLIVGVSLVVGRGMTFFIGIISMMSGTIVSCLSLFQEGKDEKAFDEKRNKVYVDYLLDLRKQLYQLSQTEKDYWNYHFPSLKSIQGELLFHYSRMYEKSFYDQDFLLICIGKKSGKASFSVDMQKDAFSMEQDVLKEKASDLYDAYMNHNELPKCISLKETHIGLLGERQFVESFVERILFQICYFHSYHDIHFICLTLPSHHLSYMNWYPHCGIKEYHLNGILDQPSQREEVLNRLYYILKERQKRKEEKRTVTSFYPHYILFVEDSSSFIHHPISFFMKEALSLGVTFFYYGKSYQELPDCIASSLHIQHFTSANVISEKGMEKNEKIYLDYTVNNFECAARFLHSITHVQGIEKRIPSYVSFFDLYHVKEAKEIPILHYWEQNKARESLSVPIGKRTMNETVFLDMHEYAHGPHGLIAGTTGSGKSELLQTLILSLALHYSPYEVGFLLIDYKGGGMAHLFNELPHTLGVMTNLDGDHTYRAMLSIQAEVKRRQELFQELSINHIHQYSVLFDAGKVKRPLPHLMIICDEFAELKKEHPEFMSELISIARIGRTLGIHLILSTQKPSGIIDDQIWSNARFKIALKMQDERDSREILKTGDASLLTEAGRAYLQVGNNEIYELFQSAYTGFYLNENETKQMYYELNHQGQSQKNHYHFAQTSKTQLNNVIDEIIRIEKKHSYPLKKIWLPPLKTNLLSPYMEREDINSVQHISLHCPIGLMDLPEKQLQKDYCLHFDIEGNLAIFSSRGYGKTITLMTIIFTLCVKNNPLLLQFYILDFSHSLMVLKDLPHVVDLIALDEKEKIYRFQKRIEKIMEERKRILRKEKAQDYSYYNQTHLNLLSAIIIVIDYYEGVKELDVEFEEFLLKVLRIGPSLGLFVILTAHRKSVVRMSMFSYLKQMIVHYMFDKNELYSLIGKQAYQMKPIKGRAFVDNRHFVQMYTPAVFDNRVSFIKRIEVMVKQIKESYKGEKLKEIQVLPDHLSLKRLKQKKKEYIIGMDVETLEIVETKLDLSPYIIVGDSLEKQKHIMTLFISQHHEKKFIFSKKQKEDLVTFLKEARENDALFIEDMDLFIDAYKTNPDLFVLFKNALEGGMKCVGCVPGYSLRGYDELSLFFKSVCNGLMLGKSELLMGYAISHFDMRNSEGLWIENGKCLKVKLIMEGYDEK